MARIELRGDDDLGAPVLVASIRDRRRGDLLKIDRLLLHSPPFAEGWNNFLRIVIEGLSLPERESQFVMCVIGVLNGADYELASHEPRFIAAGGSQAQLDALSDVRAAIVDTTLFDERARAILGLTYEMTVKVSVVDATFEAARRALSDDRELVEVIGLISTYNMVSRFVVALDIQQDSQGL